MTYLIKNNMLLEKNYKDELIYVIIGVKLMRALHGEYHIFAHAMQRTH